MNEKASTMNRLMKPSGNKCHLPVTLFKVCPLILLSDSFFSIYNSINRSAFWHIGIMPNNKHLPVSN